MTLPFDRRLALRATPLILLVLTCALRPSPAAAEADARLRPEEETRPDGIHVLDGSYVLNVGALHINITNHGLIGSQYTQVLPYSAAPSGQWPGGSGHEYLWGAGLWVGGSVTGQLSVTTGQPERELRPGDNLRDTIYEARDGSILRPERNALVTGRRLPESGADDDGDGRLDEDFLNGIDDDGDGQIDEDFGQLGSQMMTSTMHDNTGLVRELYPDHLPLGITVVQRAAAFAQDDYEDIVIFDYEIANTGVKQIKDVYLGLYVDCDIQRRENGGSAPDDLAGYFRGAVRGSDNTFHRLQVGWMKDAAEVDPLPGVFGAMVLGHDTDPLQYYAPNLVGVNSFQIFATNARDIQDGEPFIDSERYAQMSRKQIDRDRRTDQPGDLKFMMASGPFGNLPPGRRITYQVAMVVGDGMDDMLRNALKASEIHRGRDFNVDNDITTGVGGRERMVCVGDYPTFENGQDRIFSYRYIFMDNDCIGTEGVMGAELISKEGLFALDAERRCIWVNADNCEECFRIMGQECTLENQLYWASQASSYRTGTGGRETHLPWVFSGDMPPMAPNVRIVPGDQWVELFWDDVSEYDPDPDNGQLDFESYRVWRVANWIRPSGTSETAVPEARLWGLIGEYDLVNSIPAGVGGSQNERGLGRNTGLEPARYVPNCLSDPRFEGLAAAMQAVVDADTRNRLAVRPPLRDSHGAVIPGLESLVAWESAPTVLDTFFAVASRAASPPPNRVDPKRGVTYYHHRDSEVHNGFETFYAVVASDHDLIRRSGAWVPAGFGIQSDPGNNQQAVTPAPAAQTAARRAVEGVNIYAFPNPATREALAEFQSQPPGPGNPTGVHITFNNLPAAHNTVKIFTTSGDLVATVPHDGRDGNGAASWNLVSYNGQEVVSGIYLYVVESDDQRFAPFRGRFVIVR